MTDARKVRVDMRVEESLLGEVDTLAKREDRSRSDMLRILVREGLAARQRKGKK